LHDVHVKDDGTILKNGVIVKNGRAKQIKRSTKNQGIGCLTLLFLGLQDSLLLAVFYNNPISFKAFMCKKHTRHKKRTVPDTVRSLLFNNPP
jgi:hypothetical protein